MKTVITLISLAAVLACIAAVAQTQRPASAGLAERFRQLDRNGDGKVSSEEYAGPLFREMDQNADGFVTLEEATRFFQERRTPHTEEVAEQRPGEPPLKEMPDSDATRDASGRGQLFESIVVPGFTSIQEGMNGLAIADLNNDGLLDLVFAADPDNSGSALSMARYESKVYWNTGLHGANVQAIMMSVYRTLKLRGMDPLDTIVEALRQYVSTGALPPLPAKNCSDR